jgi:hypothetical protein
MTNFRLHDEQRVNGLRKIAQASVFRLKWQLIFVYIYVCIYLYIEMTAYLYTVSIYGKRNKRKTAINGNR